MATRTLNSLEADSDLSATHRLPTVSAADALEDADEGCSAHLPTGVDALDRALADLGPESDQRGGVVRGQITEIWGPPGVGKTAVGIQLAANALIEGHNVVWVDCFHPLYFPRLSTVLDSLKSARPPQSCRDEGTFTHYSLSTLPHFLALLCRPRPATISPNTKLIIIDSFSALFNSSLPKGPDQPGNSVSTASGKSSQRGRRNLPMTSAKRIQTLQYVVSALQKLAATRDCAVVVLSQCATKMRRSERGATLVAAISATVWEHGIASRVVLFRDWAWARAEENGRDKRGLSGLRFAGLQKLNGKVYDGGVGHVAAFDVNAAGLVNAHHDVDHQPAIKVAPTPRKRKLGHTDVDEIPDSDDADEDFGWGEDDEEALPAMPPQWQGSEDLIIGTQRDSDNSSDEEDHAGGDSRGGDQEAGDNGDDDDDEDKDSSGDAVRDGSERHADAEAGPTHGTG